MSISTEEKYARIVEELFLRTTARTLSWESSSDDRTFTAKFGAFEVRLVVDGRSGAEPDYVVEIYSEFGKILDRFTDVSLADLSPTIEPFTTYFALMKELYRRAGREARGAEQALDGLLGELGIKDT